MLSRQRRRAPRVPAATHDVRALLPPPPALLTLLLLSLPHSHTATPPPVALSRCLAPSRCLSHSMPDDVVLTPIDRNIGEDHVVDEFIFEFTHTCQMDWMLPGMCSQWAGGRGQTAAGGGGDACSWWDGALVAAIGCLGSRCSCSGCKRRCAKHATSRLCMALIWHD